MESMELSEIMWIALIGFVFVLGMLFALVVIMQISGAFFKQTAKRNEVMEAQAGADVIKKKMVSPEEIAAIAVALRLHTLELHDRETAILTIQSIKKVYSPWSAKANMLRELPQRAVKSNKL